MFKLLALISVLTSTALVQSAVTNNTNPLIPPGISDSCKSFLNALNGDATLASCLSPLTNITSIFSPGSSMPSSSATISALTDLCSSQTTNACSPSAIRQNLTQFYVACPAELTTTNSVPEIRIIYEALYTFLPLQTAVCSKDDSGNYCAVGSGTSSREFNEDSSLEMSEILALLYFKNDNGALVRRGQPSILPNLTQIASNNLPFLFITPNLSASQLCVTCTRQVITAYINFESNLLFADGINNSILLSSQSALYSAVQSKCPSSFLNGAVAAGGLSGSTSKAFSTYDTEYQRIITLVMGAVTLVALAL